MIEPSDILTCADCGTTTLRRSPSQLYCAACSGIRDTARKAAWAQAHPQSPRPDSYERAQSAMVDKGRETSLNNRADMAWLTSSTDDDLHTVVRVAVPFDWAGSKNAVWRNGRGGHVYARKEGAAFRAALTASIQQAGAIWHQGKVWIDIFVEKPNNRGDAINFVDVVCDAIKDATGVDDRWFSLRRLDWAIVKDQPRILVGVAQAVTEDHQACSHCGRVLPYTEFGSNRSTKTGRARVCKDCAAPKRGRRQSLVAASVSPDPTLATDPTAATERQAA